MIYAINYDLCTPGKDYKGLYEAIKQCGVSWWHYLDSTWLVDTSLNANTIADRLKAHLDNNDNMLIIRVTRDYQGWLPNEAWEWINSRIQ